MTTAADFIQNLILKSATKTLTFKDISDQFSSNGKNHIIPDEKIRRCLNKLNKFDDNLYYKRTDDKIIRVTNTLSEERLFKIAPHLLEMAVSEKKLMAKMLMGNSQVKYEKFTRLEKRCLHKSIFERVGEFDITDLVRIPRGKLSWSAVDEIICKMNCSMEHRGQYKLLLSELLFLILYLMHAKRTVKIGGKEYFVVVYPGAASGIHIPLLNKMFPGILWILYDSNKFDNSLIQQSIFVKNIKPQNDTLEALNDKKTAMYKNLADQLDKNFRNIWILNMYFEDQDVNWIKGMFKDADIGFISDIRSGAVDKVDQEEGSKIIIRDEEMQTKWVTDIVPFMYMLKMRGTWSRKSDYVTEWPWGFDFNQNVHKARTSAETRLIGASENGKIKKMKISHSEREEQMFYENIVLRRMLYNMNKKLTCHCCDCVTSRFIIEMWLKFKFNASSENAITEVHNDICKYLNHSCFESCEKTSGFYLGHDVAIGPHVKYTKNRDPFVPNKYKFIVK